METGAYDLKMRRKFNEQNSTIKDDLKHVYIFKSN